MIVVSNSFLTSFGHHLLSQATWEIRLLLGIEVKTLPDNSMLLAQSKYIQDLLHKTKTIKAQSISLPMTSSSKLTKSGSDMFSNSM